MLTARDYLWALPALLIGAVAMLAGEVGAGRVAANLAFFLLGLAIVADVASVSWRPGVAAACVLGGLLLLTLLMPGLDGVRRWIDAGPLSINVSLLVAPLLLVVLAHLLARERTVAAIAVATGVQLIHLLQPDAAQGAAFAAGAIVLLLLSVERPSAIEIGGAAGLLALTIATFTREDPLEPIPEVEGLVGLARDAALPLGVLAVLTCALLAAPFARAAALSRRSPDRVVRAAHASVCAYVVVQLLAPIALHVPVPVMGYGATTVLAYAAAISASLLMPQPFGTRRRQALVAARGSGPTSTGRPPLNAAQ
jgi:cell division protein FtsW (lipid II flippase)